MSRTKLNVGCLLLVIAFQTTVLAQSSNYDEPPCGHYQPVPPFPPDLGFTYHHASTAAEGWLRGRAAVIHATGNFWLSLSQSLICREQARWLALTNHQHWIEHCIALRSWHEFDRQHRIEQQRVANEARWLSVYKVYLLTPSQFNRTTGEIIWPETLRTVQYSSLRERLDELFRQRAGYIASPIGSEVELQQCVESLARTLRRNASAVERTDYLTAQKFLCGLKYESAFRTLLN